MSEALDILTGMEDQGSFPHSSGMTQATVGSVPSASAPPLHTIILHRSALIFQRHRYHHATLPFPLLNICHASPGSASLNLAMQTRHPLSVRILSSPDTLEPQQLHHCLSLQTFPFSMTLLGQCLSSALPCSRTGPGLCTKLSSPYGCLSHLSVIPRTSIFFNL